MEQNNLQKQQRLYTESSTVNLLKRLAEEMGMALNIEFVPKENI